MGGEITWVLTLTLQSVSSWTFINDFGIISEFEANKKLPQAPVENNYHFKVNHMTTKYNFQCPSNYSSGKGRQAEDILCMDRPKFMKNYKNPCWNSNGTFFCLPYFQIAGTSRSGMTDLYERLMLHSSFVRNGGLNGRETNFWTWKRHGLGVFDMRITDQGDFYNLTDFCHLFTDVIRKSIETGNHDKITGHSEPMDLWESFDWRKIPQNDPEGIEPMFSIPDLIRHINPGLKLIVIIRDPVERLYSHYIHDKRYVIRELNNERNIPDDLYVRRALGDRVDPEAFHDYVERAIALYRECVDRFGVRGCLHQLRIHYNERLPLVAGLYSDLLKDWLRIFPENQVLIIRFEDYVQNTGGAIQKVLRFLDIYNTDDDKIREMACHKLKRKQIFKSEISPMLDKTKRMLQMFYAKSQNNLEELLNLYHIKTDLERFDLSCDTTVRIKTEL